MVDGLGSALTGVHRCSRIAVHLKKDVLRSLYGHPIIRDWNDCWRNARADDSDYPIADLNGCPIDQLVLIRIDEAFTGVRRGRWIGAGCELSSGPRANDPACDGKIEQTRTHGQVDLSSDIDSE